MIIKNDSLKSQTGFTLVELMVGMVIGLITSLVIMQVFSDFEGNKRSTVGISDAQTSGSIGLYLIQRELQFAGYGAPIQSGTMPVIAAGPSSRVYADYTNMTQAQILAAQATLLTTYNAQIAADTATVAAGENYSALRCSNAGPGTSGALTIASDIDGDESLSPAPSTPTPRVTVDVLAPVVVTDGGTGNDSIAIQYNSTVRGAIPSRVTSTSGTNYVGIQNNLGCRNGDIVLTMPNMASTPGNCAVSTVTSTNTWLDTAGNTNSLNVTSNSGMTPGALTMKLACLGQIRRVIFDVNTATNELRKGSIQTGANADMQPILSEIVALQAQYGISATGNSEVVNQWVDATGAWAFPLSVANRNRIKAVRVAIVARNNLLEKTAVSQACNGTATGLSKICIWATTTNPSPSNVTLPGANWANYRYRVYETVIPLRNVLAAAPQL